MNYDEFQNAVVSALKQILGNYYNVTIEKVIKNNDVELCAVLIQKNSYEGAVPTIYLEDYYELYNASVDIRDIVNRILMVYRKQVGRLQFSVDAFKNFENVKGRIMLKLINYERNQKSLCDTPHRRYLDLAVVYYVIWETKETSQLTSLIKNSHMNLWNIKESELYDLAFENTKKLLSVDIANIKDLMEELLWNNENCHNSGLSGKEKLEAENFDENYPMYIMTNKIKMFGAVNMIYEEYLKKLYKMFKGSFFILPSSVHEVILVPEWQMEAEELKKMVVEVNENELDYMEVLSDNVYHYDGNILEIA